MLHFHRCRPGRLEPSFKCQVKVGAPGRGTPSRRLRLVLAKVERPDATRPPLHAEAKTRPPGMSLIQSGRRFETQEESDGTTTLPAARRAPGPRVALQETSGRAPVVLAGSRPPLFPVHPYYSDLSRAIIEAGRMGCQREHAAISAKFAARGRELGRWKPDLSGRFAAR